MILHSPQYILPSNQTHYNTIHFVTIFVLQISHFLRIQKYCPKCTTSCEVNLESSLNVACTCRKEKSKISYQENFISLSYQSMCKKSAQPLKRKQLMRSTKKSRCSNYRWLESPKPYLCIKKKIFNK